VVIVLSRQIFGGNDGDRLLELRDRLRKRVKETKVEGTEPVKEFTLRSRKANFVSEPKDEGIDPTKRF
jgi:hypothetical protein